MAARSLCCGLCCGLCCPASVAADTASLCEPQETVVFACHVGGKMVSLCRTAQGAGQGEGPLSYRFGSPAALELRYPQPGRQARTAFTITSTPLAGGGETTVGFRQGLYSYTVYSRVMRGEDGVTPLFEDGITIARRGKVVSRQRCVDGGEGFRESLLPVAVK